MPDYGHDLLFGYFLTPDAGHSEAVVELARLADSLGLDILGVQDHPYQPRFLDMWTLLSALAAQTRHIRLVPDVVNVPLRPPAVLARAVASLDILSGGRVELGLGSGAFGRAVGAMGGPVREPGPAVDALAEAITVIRSLWTPGPAITFNGQHYALRGAQPGPFAPHPIGIWLGAYKPRMLRLTGRMADGWIPTLAYAAPAEIGPMSRIIDEAAQAEGRDPAAIRRVYNISGRFSAVERGFLDGPPEVWVSQLTDLVMEYGFSAFVLGPGEDAAGDLERFAVEVAPGVREALSAIRRSEQRALAAGEQAPTPVEPADSVRPSPATTAVPRSDLLPEDARPHAVEPSGGAETPAGRASQQTLLQVHDQLRGELAEMREAAVAVAEGRLDPVTARSLLNRMTVRQNYWTLGAFCAQFCRFVSIHHTIEDQHMFPALRRLDGTLAAVLERLREEHEIIAESVERLDVALTAMMTEPSGVDEVRRLAGELSDALLSHFAYEENELLGPLGRSSIVV